MQITPRSLLRLLLVIVCVAILLTRLLGHRHAPIRDLSVTSPLNKPSLQPAPAEAYPVFTGLYRATPEEKIAIAENSATDIPQVGGMCLKPSTPEEKQLTDGFVAANANSVLWERKFDVKQGYQVLTPDQVDQARTCIATRSKDASCSAYQQLRYVRFLGVPSFNSAHTRALVSVIKSCGEHCGTGGIFVAEKHGDSWDRLPTTDFNRDCSWMY